MRTKLQVLLHLSVVAAMLLAAIGIIPASASAPSVKRNLTVAKAPGPDDVVLQATRKMIAEREAEQAACEANQGTEVDSEGNVVPQDCEAEGEREGDPNARDDWYYARRIAGDPSAHFTMAEAATLRAKAAEQTAALQAQQAHQPVAPQAYGGAWSAVGPNPMVLWGRYDGAFDAMAGRIGALAIRSSAPYTMYVGGAQGGVWTMAYPYTGTWTPRTDQASSLAIGALALAPSNENIIYVGTGEGALSGDSYFGHGVLKSTNGGNTFSQISAAGYFTNVSISKIVVDPNNANTLYAGTLRGRGGARRTSPPDAQPFGVYKSTDGGINWTPALIAETNVLALSGVTDLAMDPQNSSIIYASILGRGISKTVDAGNTWTTVNLPAGTYTGLSNGPSRIALGIGRPSIGVSETLYAGFEYINTSNVQRLPRVYKSTDDGNTWAQTLDVGNVVRNYCGSQCFYDNVIAVDPISPTVVYALGLYNYATGSGGVYRSDDGGDHWIDLGVNLHPDYHAIAIRKDDPSIVVIGNDGGAWWSSTRGGRPGGSTDPLTATQWSNLNGTVAPGPQVTHRSGLQLGQFTSIANNPTNPNAMYGGFQDNGTEHKFGSATWYDVASGDGGQVLVDPTDATYVYGTYYGVSPYRFDDGAGLYTDSDGNGGFLNNYSIANGIDTANDRSEFYTPWIMDPGNPERLYLGTQRVYRTDNAKATKASDVFWNAISDDLTSGCPGAAANGGRGCVISTLAASAESPAVYVGTEEGWLWLSTNATAASPTWSRIDISGTTPMRPVAALAVDRSNYRVAYVGFNGFSAATPGVPGHVFKTIDAGNSWTDISSNLPDIPVNNLILDPSDPNTLYAGTDVGPYVTYNGGASWSLLGTGFPIVSIEGMDLNPFTRQLLAGTHGRGAWRLQDGATNLPALQIGKSDDGKPVGPGSFLTYQITVKNYGNITATNLVITDPVPANTSFVAAGSGGTFDGSKVVFNVADVAPAAANASPNGGIDPGNVVVTFTVHVATSGIHSGNVITNDGYLVSSAEVPTVYGSPHYNTLAPSHAFAMSPNYQWDGTRSGQEITYLVSIKNLGYSTDSYTLGTAGNAAGFNTTLWDSTFTSLKYTTDPVLAGDSAIVGVKVVINPAISNGTASTVTVSADSVFNPINSHAVQIKTIAVTDKILLVDDDGDGPNVDSYYQAALNAYGLPYNIADLALVPELPQRYLKAHKVIVWYAGATYPGNLGLYDTNLAAFLNNGGRLFMSGWDLLDQAAGTTPFVYNYLHINWDGSETQNDKGTGSTTAVISNSVTAGLGVLPYTNFVSIGLGSADFSDQLTPVDPAEAAFVDSGTGQTDGLTVDTGLYKVMFLAYPYEAINNTSSQNALMARALNWFFQNEAPSGVSITGPNQGFTNVGYDFTAQVTPVTTTQPITYTWQATGQSAVIHTGGGASDMVNFSWPVAGTKTVTVTANNGFGSVMNTAQITIKRYTLYLPLVQK
jgi:uncharacterized repeat protein (TIGR01451 family)